MHRPRGFTLIELLVVIGIIAMLIAILLPVLGFARDRGKAVQCLANLRTIGQGVYLYAGDFDGHFPLSSHSTGNAFSVGNWITTLEQYGVSIDLRRCPDDPTQRLTSFVTNDFLEPGGGGYSKISLIPRPATTVYAVEAHRNYLADHLHAHLDAWSTAQDMTSEIDVARHDGASNNIYLDGHASALVWVVAETQFSSDFNWFNPPKAP